MIPWLVSNCLGCLCQMVAYLKHLCMVWHHWIRIYNLRSMHYHLQRLANTYCTQSDLRDPTKRICVSRGVMGSVPFFIRLFLLLLIVSTPSGQRSLTLVERWTMPLRRAEEHRTRAPVYAGPCHAWLDLLGCEDKLPLKKRPEMVGIDSMVRKKTDKRIWILKNVPSIFEWRCFSTKEPTVQSRIGKWQTVGPFLLTWAWPRDRYQRQSSNIYTHVKRQGWWLGKCPTAQQLAHTSSKKAWPVGTNLEAPLISWNCWIQRWFGFTEPKARSAIESLHNSKCFQPCSPAVILLMHPCNDNLLCNHNKMSHDEQQYQFMIRALLLPMARQHW